MLLEALLADAIAVIDAPLAPMARLPQHARQATSTAMHSLLLDLRSERGLTTSVDQASQAHVPAVPTNDEATEAGSSIATRHKAEAQVREQAREAQAEVQRLNKQTQEIRAAHTKTIQEHTAAYAPMETASSRLKDAANTSWSLLLGHHSGVESTMDSAAVAAAQAAEHAIFKRVEAEMQRYGIVDKVAADARVLEAVGAADVANHSADYSLGESQAESSTRTQTREEAENDQVIDSLMQQLKAREDPQEIAQRSQEEESFEHIERLKQQLESSNLQELFDQEMKQQQWQHRLEEQRQDLAAETIKLELAQQLADLQSGVPQQQ